MTDNQTIAPHTAPLTGGERVRLFRKRKAKDLLLIGIELLPTERDALIRLGLLHKSKRGDREAVRDALEQFLERHLDPPPLYPLGEWRSNGSPK